jgi:hypothetical protein
VVLWLYLCRVDAGGSIVSGERGNRPDQPGERSLDSPFRPYRPPAIWDFISTYISTRADS